MGIIFNLRMYCICMWELEWEELYVGSSFLWLVICHLLLSNAACGCRLGPSFAGVVALVLLCVGSSRNLDFVQGVGDNSYTFREGHHVIFFKVRWDAQSNIHLLMAHTFINCPSCKNTRKTTCIWPEIQTLDKLLRSKWVYLQGILTAHDLTFVCDTKELC